MKFYHIKLFLCTFLTVASCNTVTNTPEFINKVSGRYLYNSDEIIEVYFENNEMYLKWRGANNIKPLLVNENTFYVKEMNEKIQFLTNPANQLNYIVLVPKVNDKTITYNFKKLKQDEKVPNEYLQNNQYNKALEGYLAIQKKDSLDISINESDFNKLGYKSLNKKDFEKAIQIFKINVALYPNSANVYDSLGEAFMKSGDTLKAILNYKKSLTLDSGNARAKRLLKKLEKKE
tara:strand:- start:189 stop:887 length:699 start_codon:yes stop_codon:yes gene_type:complete